MFPVKSYQNLKCCIPQKYSLDLKKPQIFGDIAMERVNIEGQLAPNLTFLQIFSKKSFLGKIFLKKVHNIFSKKSLYISQ